MTRTAAARLRLASPVSLTAGSDFQSIPSSAGSAKHLRVTLELPSDLVAALRPTALTEGSEVTNRTGSSQRSFVARLTGFLDWTTGMVRLSGAISEGRLHGPERQADRWSTADSAADRFGLTAREREVAQRLADGKSNVEIALELGISAHTARRHTESVLHKLGVHSRAAVAAKLSAASASLPEADVPRQPRSVPTTGAGMQRLSAL